MEKYRTDYSRIFNDLQKRPMNQAELEKTGIRQNVTRALRKLLQEGKIRPYIKLKPLPKIKPVGILKEEIYFSIAPNEFPQDILDIKSCIDNMCKGDKTAYENFINQCIEGDITRADAIKIAYDLIAGLHPDLKARIVFELAYYEPQIKEKNYDPQKNEWTFTTGSYGTILRNYDYFIKN